MLDRERGDGRSPRRHCLLLSFFTGRFSMKTGRRHMGGGSKLGGKAVDQIKA
jgi:hypothetical protein